QHPDGADYVIVPAMSRDDDPAALQWIGNQSGKGAIVIGVCAGAKVVGAAGLLHGKRATTHWYSIKELRGKHPTVRYVRNRRLVTDAWSRTYRSQAVTFSRAAGAQQSRNGIRILPDEVVTNWPAARLLPAIDNAKPAEALDSALGGIAARYGTRTTDFVAMQL